MDIRVTIAMKRLRSMQKALNNKEMAPSNTIHIMLLRKVSWRILRAAGRPTSVPNNTPEVQQVCAT